MKAVATHSGIEELNGIEVEAYMKECVTIDPLFLDEEFIRLPSDIATWNERYSDAMALATTTYRERKRAAGRLWNDPEFLGQLQEAAGKKPTKEMIEGGIADHDDYRAALAHEIEAERMKQKIKGVLHALDAKRDSLVSLGASDRVERQREPLIRDDE